MLLAYLYCSSDDLTSTQNVISTKANQADSQGLLHTNYFLQGFAGIPGSGASVSLFLAQPQFCSYWFGDDYPTTSPYEKSPSPVASTAYTRSTTYIPNPLNGWLATSQYPALLAQYQTYPTWLSQSTDSNWGTLNKQSAMADLSSGSISGDGISTTTYKTSTGSSGLLAGIPLDFYYNPNNPSTPYQPLPYFNQVSGSESDVDNALANAILNFITALSLVDKSVLSQKNPSTAALQAYYASVNQITYNMPYGAIVVSSATAPNWQYTMQIGTDSRMIASQTFPPQGFRQLMFQTEFSHAVLSNLAPGAPAPTLNGRTVLSQGIRAMPYKYLTTITVPVGSLVGSILFPFGVSFLLPIFVIILVKEKEDRIVVMMRMNGLKTWVYYLANFCHFYLLHILASAIFIIMGRITKLDFFTKTEAGVIVILFAVWGLAQIALAFFISVFFNNSRNSLVLSFLLVLTGVVVAEAANALFTSRAPFAMSLWPPFAFYRGLNVINVASYASNATPYTVAMLTGSDEVLASIIFLIVETIIFNLLAVYLTLIVKTEYGIARPWHFIFTEPYKAYQSYRHGEPDVKPDEDQELLEEDPGTIDAADIANEDEDVAAERNRVLNNRYARDSPLVIKNMRKVYDQRGRKKVAVRTVSFAVEKDTCMALLGPNGAGKVILALINGSLV